MALRGSIPRTEQSLIKKVRIMNKKEFLPELPKEFFVDIDVFNYNAECDNMAPAECVFDDKESDLI